MLQSIGDDDDTVESSSAEIMQTEEGFAPVFFDPRPLTNLVLIDELESLSPVLDMQACSQQTWQLTCDCCVAVSPLQAPYPVWVSTNFVEPHIARFADSPWTTEGTQA